LAIYVGTWTTVELKWCALLSHQSFKNAKTNSIANPNANPNLNLYLCKQKP